MATAEEMCHCQTVNCGYIYDPDRGDRRGKIPKGTRFKELPDDWRCAGPERRCSNRSPDPVLPKKRFN